MKPEWSESASTSSTDKDFLAECDEIFAQMRASMDAMRENLREIGTLLGVPPEEAECSPSTEPVCSEERSSTASTT